MLNHDRLHDPEMGRIVLAHGNQAAQHGGSIIPCGREPEKHQHGQAAEKGDGVAAIEQRTEPRPEPSHRKPECHGKRQE